MCKIYYPTVTQDVYCGKAAPLEYLGTLQLWRVNATSSSKGGRVGVSETLALLYLRESNGLTWLSSQTSQDGLYIPGPRPESLYDKGQ